MKIDTLLTSGQAPTTFIPFYTVSPTKKMGLKHIVLHNIDTLKHIQTEIYLYNTGSMNKVYDFFIRPNETIDIHNEFPFMFNSLEPIYIISAEENKINVNLYGRLR